MKQTRLFMFASRYRYFIAGALAVLLVYGVVFFFKRLAPEREPPLPEVRKLGFERFVLANGLEVIVHSNAAAPVVSLNVSYRVGSRDESPGTVGLTHLTEHLMLAGAAARRGAEPQSWVERLGAWDNNGATDRDRTRLYMTVPKQALDAALWVESERMGFLSERLTDGDVALARQDVLNELRRSRAGPAASFEAALTDAVFSPGHPYSRLPGGVPADVETISLQHVRRWIEEHYGPNNATLVVAGDVDPAEVRRRVETYFGPLRGGRRSRQNVTWIPWREPPSRYATPAIPAGTLVLVWAVPGSGSPDLDYLDLARHVVEARLTRRLVVETGAAKSVEVDLSPYQLCSLLVLTVRAGAEGRDAEISKVVEQELADLARAEIAPADLLAAKRNIFTSLLFTSERVGGPVGVAEILASAAVLAGDAAEFNKTVDRVSAASADNVLSALVTWLPYRAATLITSGPSVGQPEGSAPASDRPRQMPPVGESGGPVRVAHEQMKLSNGLTVWVAKRAGPVGVLKLAWRKDPALSVRDELFTKAALNLLAEGASGRRASDSRQDGAQFPSRLILDDTTGYYAIGSELLSQNIGRGLRRLSEMVSGVKFREPHVAALRGQWERRAAGGGSASRHLESAVLLRLINGGRLDEARQSDCGGLTSFTAADIQRTYDARLRPEDATLIVVGDTDLASLRERITELFGSWRGESAPQAPPSSRVNAAENGGLPIYVVDRPDKDYAVVLAGVPLPHADGLAGDGTEVLTNLLDSRAARLLRDETSISHDTFAGRLQAGGGGVVYLYADAQAERVPDVIRLIEQTVRTADEPAAFCAGEFRRAQAALAQRGRRALESAEGSAGFLASSLGDAGGESRAAPVSCEQILSLRRQLSESPRFVWLVLGDAARLADRLRQLGHKTETLRRPCWVALY